MILLLIILSIQTSLCQLGAKQLIALLNPTPALGEPWPKIPGPNLNDRVCIVGAGAAGIHMAASLKKRNYENVVVFEKSGRVGGKCYDINYKGTPHAQGAYAMEANYFNADSLIPFLREYDLDEIVPLRPTDIWTENSGEDPKNKLTRTQYLLLAASKLTNSISPEVNAGFFLRAVIRYIQIHKEMFGLYEGDLMQRPTPEVMYRIRGTILDFLQREDILALVPIFQTTQTTAGYGHLDEIGALYGLIWHNPRLVLTMALTALGKNKEPFSTFQLKYGFEHVWKTIVKTERLNLRFHTDIVNIRRKSNGLYLKTWQNFEARTEVCDFLIWTPEASQLLRSLEKTTKEEKHLLGTLKPEVYYAHLMDVEGGVRHSPTTAFMANVLSKEEEYAVTWTDDTAGLLTPGITTPEGVAKYNNGTGPRTLFALHAPSKEYTNEAFLKKKMRDFLMKGFNVTNVEFLNTIAWSYLPRWSPEEAVEGRHWDVFEMQGKNKIWYAGVSASYESVRSVVSYNNRLLKQMVPRGQYKTPPKPFNGQVRPSGFQSGKGASSAVTVNNCKYSCTSGGGCKVQYLGRNRRGYSLGSCWPNGGSCGGTPNECQNCNKVINC